MSLDLLSCFLLSDNNTCHPGYFRCDSGHCILEEARCDFSWDCYDHSDEEFCCELCFPLLLHAGGSDFKLYDGSDLKTYLLIRLYGPGALAGVRPTGFFLLQYSVLLTVESSSLLYLLLYR